MVLFAIAVLAALASLLGPSLEPVRGQAVVVDGDTLRIGSARIRLTGLDAPEIDQTCEQADGSTWRCGEQARQFLIQLISTNDVSCAPAGRDVYRRLLARCEAGGSDINAVVAAGWAVSTGLEYFSAEKWARDSRLGVWQGAFERPADWRRDHGQSPGGFWEWLRSWLSD